MSRIVWPRRWRYDWQKGGTFGTTRADPPPAWLLLTVVAILALLVFLGWLNGWSL